MAVELRLLLYMVVLGTAWGLAVLIRRRAYSFWFHMAVYVLLLTGATAGILSPLVAPLVAMPIFCAFLALGILPSLLLMAARNVVEERRFTAAYWFARVASILLGMPAPIRFEAGLYSALSASEQGRAAVCAKRLRRLERLGVLAQGWGGGTLAVVLPLFVERRWADLLAELDEHPSRAPPVLVLEARAAAEVGDLDRALHACDTLGEQAPGEALLAQMHRVVLAAAGRAATLDDALRRHLPLAAGPAAAAALSVARAHEAAGDLERAEREYAALERRARGSILREARAGRERVRTGRVSPARPTAEQMERVVAIEARRLAEPPLPRPLPLLRRGAATFAVVIVATILSTLVLTALGAGALELLMAGALSAPLIRGEGEWWRLATTMQLHGGWWHLLMNTTSILFIGVPLESRLGSARTLLIYFGSGLVGSLASVYLNATDVGVGASGAAMGLVGALLVLVHVRPALFGGPERRRWARVLWVALAATVALGVLERHAVDNAAHVVGCLAGALLAGLLLPRVAVEPARGGRAGRLAPAGRATVLAAGLLVLLQGAAVAQAVGQWHVWSTPRVVSGSGAELELPGWMRTTDLGDAGTLAYRAPSELVLLFGARPEAAPRPLALLPEDGVLRRIYLRRHPEPVFDAARMRFPTVGPDEEREAGAVFADGFQLVLRERDGAYVLALLPLDFDAEDLYAPIIERAAETLR